MLRPCQPWRLQRRGVVPTLPPAGRLIRLATRFSCKSAGFDKLSQRPLAELVEANGREATSFRSSCSSASPRTTLPQPWAWCRRVSGASMVCCMFCQPFVWDNMVFVVTIHVHPFVKAGKVLFEQIHPPRQDNEAPHWRSASYSCGFVPKVYRSRWF